MMNAVNCWLLALSFVLGLVLTLAFMIRRVKREVPVYGAAKLTSGSAGESKTEVIAKPTLKAKAEPESESKTEVIAIPAAAGSDTDADDSESKAGYSEGKTEVIKIPAAAAGLAGAAAVAGSSDDDDDSDAGESKTEVIATPAAAGTGDAEGKTEVIAIPAAAGSDAGESKTEVIKIPAAAAGLAGAAALVGSGEEGEEPYGAGSFRGKAAPSGWTIKGNADSMLYHTTDSPSYKQTIAEVWFRDEEVAQAAGFTHWKRGRAGGAAATVAFAAIADVPPGRHGPGSATPAADGSGPAGWTIKGNEDSKLYHSPDSPSYKRTKAEVWFRDVATAEAAGFNRWDSGKSQRGK